jgi:hypothetical protein
MNQNRKTIRALVASIFIPLLVFSCHAQPSYAGVVTVGDLERLLQDKETHRQTFATGYIVGVHDAGHDLLHCMPKEIDPRGLIGITIGLLRKEKDKNKPADVVILEFLVARYPCVRT